MPDTKETALAHLWPIYLVIFIGFVGYSLMITLFTPMFMHAHGGIVSTESALSYRVVVLGVVLALYPLGQFFGAPILGALSDHLGRRKVLIASLLLSLLFYALIALSLVLGNLTLLMVSSLIAGLSEGNITLAQSAIADLTQAKERNRLFGYIYLSASLAYIIGPLFGGKLADPELVSWFSYALPFWLVCALLLITLVGVFFIFEETQLRKSRSKINVLRFFRDLLTLFLDRKIRSIYLVNFLIYFAVFGFFRCYPMYLVDEYHMGVSRLSEYIAWVAVPIVIANLWLTGFLSKYFSARSMTIVSAILIAIFMISIILFKHPLFLWGTLFLTALAIAICLPSCSTMLSLFAKPSEQGRVMGNNQSLQVGAEALSALAGGLLAALLIKLPLVVLAVVALVAALILIKHRQST